MESALARAWPSWLPWPSRLDGRGVWIFALTALLVLYLGFDGGGYDLVVSSDAAVVVWWVVLLAALLAVLPVTTLSRAGWAAVGLFVAFTAWEALGLTWTISSERTLQELSRVLCYLGVLVLAVTTYGDRRAAQRYVVAAVGTAIALIALVAVLSRLHPGLISGAQATGSFLPGAQGRLSWPVNYWNALAALMAIGLPLLLAVACTARRLAAQAVAAGAVPILALCAYLTFSRGGAIATAAAVVAFVALAPDRIPKLATLAICGTGSALLIAAAGHHHAIEQGLTTAAARHQGTTMLVALILTCAAVAILQAGVGLAIRHGTLPRMMRIPVSRARLFFGVAVVVAVVAALAAGAPHRLSHAWTDFKKPNAAALHQDALARFGSLSGNGRYTYWKTAVHAMPGHWPKGFGPGTFQLVWLPRAHVVSYVRNAHSLYIETLTDAGIIGLVLLAGFLLFVLGTAIRRVVGHRFEARTQAAAIAAACLAFMVSATFDWIWQVPVLPVAFMLLSAAVLMPVRPAAPDGAQRPAPARGRIGRLTARTALVAGAAASLIAIGIPLAGTNDLRASQAAAATGNTAAALADAQQAIRIEPGAMSAHLQEALVLELQDRLPAALTAARAAVAKEPTNWEPWLILSRLEAEAGHAGPSVAAYRRARTLNPESLLFSR